MTSLTTSCSQVVKTADRPELNKSNSTNEETKTTEIAESNLKLSDKDLEKYAFELGLNPQKGLTAEDRKNILNRRKLRQLERTLDSQKERLHYSKVLPLMETDQEKIDYLDIESIEGRQAWVIRNKIWSRLKSNEEFQNVVESQDLAMGMTGDLVRKSWGEPESVDHSGNSIYKNERWKYVRDVPSPNGYKRERRFVYFEGGRVVGWETE